MAVRQLSKSTILQGLPRGTKIWDQYSSVGSFELISSTVLGSSQTSITFDVSSFSSTYKDLQLRIIARTDRNAGDDPINIRFNNDTGTNYSAHRLNGFATTPSSDAFSSQTSIVRAGYVTDSASTANSFGAAIIDILDAFSTNKNKTIKSISGYASGAIVLNSGAWYSTSAISSIKIDKYAGTNFVSGSRFSLYGLKG